MEEESYSKSKLQKNKYYVQGRPGGYKQKPLPPPPPPVYDERRGYPGPPQPPGYTTTQFPPRTPRSSGYMNVPAYGPVDSPTVKGLWYMLIGGLIILVGTLVSDVCAAIALIGYILAIIGFWKIYQDRQSYPEPHQSNMSVSLIFYVLGFIFLIIGVIIIASAIFNWANQMANGSGSAEEAWEGFISSTMAGIILFGIGGFLWLIARYKLLIELIPLDKKALLNGAVILALLLSVVGLALSFQVTSDMKNLADGMDELQDSDDEQAVLDEYVVRLEEFERENRGLNYTSKGMTVFRTTTLPFFLTTHRPPLTTLRHPHIFISAPTSLRYER